MIKILMLVNWKVEYAAQPPEGKQPPDYYVQGEPYWFFRYFKEPVQVDVLDIRSFPFLERLEKTKLRFYIWQTLRAIPKISGYDLVLSHGAQSGVALSLWRRVFKGRAKHILFDIGAFNSAAEQGGALKLMQFSSRSLDGVIYHTGSQKVYYQKCFPWLLPKARFIPFGTDSDYFVREQGETKIQNRIICVGYHKRDWDTLIRAYLLLAEKLGQKGQEAPELLLVGKADTGKKNAETQKAEKQIAGKQNIGKLPENARMTEIPFIALEELIRTIQSALFCVLPLENFNYSFGQMTLLQQMALGKTVITAKVPSMTDYVEDEKTGVFYEAGNAQDLCDKMLRLFENRQLSEQIGHSAAEYVRFRYNEREMASRIETFLKEILAGK